MIYTVTLNPAVDKTLFIDGFSAGKVNRVQESRRDPGGKGINVSKTIRAMGGKSVALAIVGGAGGRFIAESLDAMGIEHLFIESARETRTNIKINDLQSGTTTDINERGHVDKADADALMEALTGHLQAGDIAVLAGKMDAEVFDIAQWIERINALGARVFLDTEGEALKIGTGSGAYLIKPNDTEFSALTDRAGNDINALAEAALKVKGVRHLAQSLGERGAVFASGDKAYYAPALKVTPVSTVGAGDSMMAALCYGFARGLEPEETYRLSVACASAAVTRPGSQSPTMDEIERLLPLVDIRRIQ